MAPMPMKKSIKPAVSKPKPSSAKPTSKATKNAANGGQIKTKRSVASTSTSRQKAKKQRTYTDKELNLPTLNTITPAGVQKPRGKKKGKVFVDDAESMRTILALVSAEREGQIESKMQKARQMEEIRESRRKEIEKKEGERKRKLDQIKDGVRRKRKGKGQADDDGAGVYDADIADPRKSRKRVSFG